MGGFWLRRAVSLRKVSIVWAEAVNCVPVWLVAGVSVEVGAVAVRAGMCSVLSVGRDGGVRDGSPVT